MIDSSKEFRKAINKTGRVMSIHDVYTFADGVMPDIGTRIFKSYSINEATSDSSGFNIGAVVIKEYKASLDNTDGTFDVCDFEGLDIMARVGLLLEDESVELIPKGKFRCVSAKNNENTIDIKAYDSMLFFDRPYTESSLQYPATIQQIVADACLCCEMTYDASTIQNSGYVVNERPDDSSLTFRDVIGFCAQIMCSYAIINKLDQLSFGWYDFDTLEKLQNNHDGGSFTYTDGDALDGGDFTDYSSGDSADGGNFEEQRKYHHFYSLGSRSVNTDDIHITGIAVKPSSDYADGDNIYLCGEEGYVLLIEENQLIQSVEQTEMVAEYIGEKMNGKRFRPLNISCKSNPCIEAGDCACVTDRKNRTYFTVITNTTFAFGALQLIECTAETPTEKNFTKYSTVTRLLNKAKRETKKQLTVYDLAMQQLTSLITNSFGVFKTEEKQEDGSVIYYLHNKPELRDSSTIWKMTADAFGVSSDGGETWNAGMDSEGNAVVNVLSAIGINADWLNAGTITAIEYRNKKGTFKIPTNGGIFLTTEDGKDVLSIDGHNINLYNYKNAGERVGYLMPVTLTDDSTKAGVAFTATQGMYLALGIMTSDTTSSSAIRIEEGENSATKTILYNEVQINNIPLIGGTATGTMFPGNTNGGVEIENGLIKSWDLKGYTGTLNFVDGITYAQYDNATRISKLHYVKMTITNGIIESYTTFEEAL